MMDVRSLLALSSTFQHLYDISEEMLYNIACRDSGRICHERVTIRRWYHSYGGVPIRGISHIYHVTGACHSHVSLVL